MLAIRIQHQVHDGPPVIPLRFGQHAQRAIAAATVDAAIAGAAEQERIGCRVMDDALQQQVLGRQFESQRAFAERLARLGIELHQVLPDLGAVQVGQALVGFKIQADAAGLQRQQRVIAASAVFKLRIGNRQLVAVARVLRPDLHQPAQCRCRRLPVASGFGAGQLLRQPALIVDGAWPCRPPSAAAAAAEVGLLCGAGAGQQTPRMTTARSARIDVFIVGFQKISMKKRERPSGFGSGAHCPRDRPVPAGFPARPLPSATATARRRRSPGPDPGPDTSARHPARCHRIPGGGYIGGPTRR